MDSQRSEAIVLRLLPVTETSLIVTWFTREFGKMKTMAKGARRPKSPFQGKIDLFYRDEIVVLRSKRSDLHLLHECFLETPHRTLRESVDRLTAASYVCELVDLATEIEDANPKLFDLLAETLGALAKRCDPVLVIWFELHLLAVAGWTPKWSRATGTDKVLTALAAANLAKVSRVRLTPAQVDDARQALWDFWGRELGRAPQSRKLLATVRGA